MEELNLDLWNMLEELLNLNQFELVLDDAENIKLVYLMNDAV